MNLFQCLFGKLLSTSPSNESASYVEDDYVEDYNEREFQCMPVEVVMHQHDDVNDIILD